MADVHVRKRHNCGESVETQTISTWSLATKELEICDTEKTHLFWQRDAPSVSEDLDKQADDGKKG